MSATPAQPPAPGAGGAAGPGLLLDQFLPEYDLSIVHADVFRATPAECYEAALQMDLFQAPVARVLIGLRALPQRLAGTLRRRGKGTVPAASWDTFRLEDMVGLGWILLGETPGVEMVLGSRSWRLNGLQAAWHWGHVGALTASGHRTAQGRPPVASSRS